MKRLFCIAATFFIFACKSPEQKNKEHIDSVVAEANAKMEAYKISQMSDSILKSSSANVMFDTVGSESGPVRILSAKLVRKEYSNYKDVHLVYMNACGKKISGIKFRWYGVNAFGDPADMGRSFERGFGGGMTDDELRPGKSASGTWDVFSGDGKTVVKAWAFEVVFTDGTKWKSDYRH